MLIIADKENLSEKGSKNSQKNEVIKKIEADQVYVEDEKFSLGELDPVQLSQKSNSPKESLISVKSKQQSIKSEKAV